jgi:hypothetical protein
MARRREAKPTPDWRGSPNFKTRLSAFPKTELLFRAPLRPLLSPSQTSSRKTSTKTHIPSLFSLPAYWQRRSYSCSTLKCAICHLQTIRLPFKERRPHNRRVTNSILTRLTFCAAALALFIPRAQVQAEKIAWQTTPVDGDWNNPRNWFQKIVPNGSSDIATFLDSTQTDISLSLRPSPLRS